MESYCAYWIIWWVQAWQGNFELAPKWVGKGSWQTVADHWQENDYSYPPIDAIVGHPGLGTSHGPRASGREGIEPLGRAGHHSTRPDLETYTRRVQVLMRFVQEAKKANDILEANWEILEMVEEPYMSKSRDTSSCVQLDSSLWGAHSRVTAMATHEAPGSVGSAGPHQWLTCHLLQLLQPHLGGCSLRRSPFEGGHPMELVVVSVVASELAMHPGMYHSPEGSKMCHVQTHCYNL